MDIKMMHNMIEKLTKCAEMEFEKGVENVDTKEMGEVVDIIKDLAEAMYYRTLVVAMEDNEYGEDYDEYGPMEDGRRGYRGQPRSKTSGRYMSIGDGRRSDRGRRGYDKPMGDYEMTPEMYEKYPAEYYRDMDRDAGRLYYTSNSSSGMSSQGGSRIYSDGRDSREGRSGQSRKSYMESKEIHKSNTPEDKEAKRKELDKWINDVTADIKELVGDMSNEEKTVLKAKIQSLHSSI